MTELDLSSFSFAYPTEARHYQLPREHRQSASHPLSQTLAALESGIRKGLYPGAQVYVSLEQQPVASVALGCARGGVPMTTATLLPWFCNVKPVIAAAFALLWEGNRLSLDDRVCEVVPEFGRLGKESITFRHVLTHTSNIKRDPVRPIRFEPRQHVLEAIYDAPANPGMTPGFAVKYGVFWGWAMLCEGIRRLTRLEYEDYLRRHVIEPLGIEDFWLQMPPSQVQRHLDRMGLLYGLDQTEPYPWPTKARLDRYDRDQPATSLVATAASVGHAYEAILASRFLRRPTTEALTARHRVGLYCENFRGFVGWGLGMVVDGAYFGSYCSPRTFGHKGLNSSFVLVDPEYGLVLTSIVNGLISTDVSDARDRLIADCVYRDLGLADGRPPAPRIVRVDHVRSVTARALPEMPDV
jgi:CubicO group peptidase (beta-lactamase class C family)